MTDRKSLAAEAAFRARLAELGATLLEPHWLGARRRHRVLCAAGHPCSPRPNSVQQRVGICRTCARNDPAAAAAAFRARLAELGATLLEPHWLGSHTPHRVRCAAGHNCTSVRKGQGICRTCAGRAWDAFYVVCHLAKLRVKFGVTSGDARRRLAEHARDGYTTVARLAKGLPGEVAPDAERAVQSALALAGEQPVQGNEYYDISALTLVLDVADGYLPEVIRDQPNVGTGARER